MARGEISINTAMSIMDNLRDEMGEDFDILDEIKCAIREYTYVNHRPPKYLILDHNSYFLMRHAAQACWSGMVEAGSRQPETCMGIPVARVNSPTRIVEVTS